MARSPRRMPERHFVNRIGWMRAAVLGANDGLLSTSSLVVGVAAAAGADHARLIITALAGLVAGAMSMAAGEYVSVSSQADSQNADLDREREELESDHAGERRELAAIYMRRGLDGELARRVADQLMAHDALEAHARDELGITDISAARPVQAALASAGAFSTGAAIPLLMVALAPLAAVTWAVIAAALLSLAALGGVGARLGGAPIAKGVVRVLLWGALAMAAAAGVGRLFGVATG